MFNSRPRPGCVIGVPSYVTPIDDGFAPSFVVHALYAASTTTIRLPPPPSVCEIVVEIGDVTGVTGFRFDPEVIESSAINPDPPVCFALVAVPDFAVNPRSRSNAADFAPDEIGTFPEKATALPSTLALALELEPDFADSGRATLSDAFAEHAVRRLFATPVFTARDWSCGMLAGAWMYDAGSVPE